MVDEIIQNEQEFEDKTLTCKVCGNEFVFTAGEQAFYKEKGFQNEPKACKECRMKKKNDMKAQRPMFPAVCADCGKETMIPFQPSDDRPVYCPECFAKRKGNQ